jgi:hypothetical protein
VGLGGGLFYSVLLSAWCFGWCQKGDYGLEVVGRIWRCGCFCGRPVCVF